MLCSILHTIETESEGPKPHYTKAAIPPFQNYDLRWLADSCGVGSQAEDWFYTVGIFRSRHYVISCYIVSA